MTTPSPIHNRILGYTIAAGLAVRAPFIRARRRTLQQRLAMLPLAGAPVDAPVVIRWDDHAIPHIEARSDTDLAAALGVVHAHLRLGQIDLMRRLALGRIAQAVGPMGVELDRTIALMALDRAVPEIIENLPPATRAWAEAFVRGINHGVAAGGEWPLENRSLAMAPAQWSLTDFFTVARLVSADISWVVAARLLRARNRAGDAWPAIWPALLRGGSPAWPHETEDLAGAALARHMRGGSNSVTVAAHRSASGAALIASDPHLGLSLPALWLIAGLHSPGISAVGLMLPGMPFIALGRNEHIAWGGTSLHAASSELVDVSGLPDGALSERVVDIPVRGAAVRTLRLRETPFGPVVSDGLLMRNEKPLALRWIGHRASDELSAMLGVMRARNFAGFRDALRGFAVPGQTMICADSDGRVGKVLAVHMPRRRPVPADIVVQPENAWDFSDVADGSEMPVWSDPADGVVASANDRPDRGEITVGYFFSPPDRVMRLRALASAPGLRAESDMRALQQDVRHEGALTARDGLLAFGPALPADFAQAWREWDGEYSVGSTGALAHELLMGYLMQRVFPEPHGFSAVWGTRLLLLQSLLERPRDEVRRALEEAGREAARGWRRWRSWGRVHRYRPAHHFGAAPVLGRRFRLAEFPAPGGDDTLHKTAHGFVRGPHYVGFGACARHVSDLADPGANRFVLYGGQDGFVGSEQFADQIPLWRRGAYITVPLTVDAGQFRHETVLMPAA
jgi:penicillin amidase